MSGPTPNQQAAIECDEHLILFAGPGAGKTSTSIRKAERILADPERRLILCTFTKEAAGELNARLQKKFLASGVNFPAQRVLISTLDALALQHLQATRESRNRINLLPPPGQSALLRQIQFEYDLPPVKELSPYLEKYQGSVDREKVMAEIEAERPEATLLIKHYLDALRAGKYVDLATVKRTCALSMSEGKIPPFFVSRLPCTDFLIDEVQDSDQLQLLFADSMANSGAITTLVGDDDQTIYSWRGACGYKGMTQFAVKHSATIIRLGENFRSNEEVVAAATRLIAYNNPDREDKQQVSMRGPGGSVLCLSRADIEKQTEWVANDILGQMSDDKVLDCAILSRTNIHLDFVEAALTAAKIPCHRASGSLWETREAMAYIGLLRYVASGSQEGMLLTLQSLQLGLDTINILVPAIVNNSKAFMAGDTSFVSELGDDERDTVKKLGKAIGRWRRDLREGAISSVIDDTAEAMLSWGAVGNPKGDRAKNSLRMAKTVATTVKVLHKMEEYKLPDYRLSRRLQILLSMKDKEAEPGDVRLMTMHGSKGLEFDMVYLIECTDDDTTESFTGAADARRVMYVAMTRAARYLRVLFSGKTPRFMREAGVTVLTGEEAPAEGD